MARFAALLYGVLCHLMFLGTFLYLIGFLGNFAVPKSIDSGPEGPLWQALLVNTLLLALFGIQHTVMARPTFKSWWTKFVARPIERSTYVLISNLLLILLFWQWRTMGGIVWNVDHPVGRGVLWALFAGGWVLVVLTTFLINHFDLFGLRQTWLYFRGREYTHVRFVTPWLYKQVRHPLYVGWMMGFWATPTMSAGHLLFAVGTTVYMLIAIQFEERNLVEFHGEYAEYRRRVPMLVPRPWRR